MSLEVRPKFSFLIALRNSTAVILPLPSSSNSLKTSSSDLGDVVMRTRTFSKMFTSHVLDDEVLV
jgi:hypothetical protein